MPSSYVDSELSFRGLRIGATSAHNQQGWWRMSQDVQVGLDGWLFLKGGSNQAEKFYTSETPLDDQKMRLWSELLYSRNTRLRAGGFEYLHFMAPDKTTVYPEFYGEPIPRYDLHPIAKFNDAFCNSGFWLPVLPSLMAEKKHRDLYYKTDSHWNYWGCFAAYVSLCGKLNARPVMDLVHRPKATVKIIMDLGGKLVPMIEEQAEFLSVLRDSQRVYCNDIVEYNESDRSAATGKLLYNSIVSFRNNDKKCDSRRVILFGDSFCEYRPHMMTGMLAETFREVTFVWNHSIDYEFIRELSPDIVISSTVERFVSNVPQDNIDVRSEGTRRIMDMQTR